MKTREIITLPWFVHEDGKRGTFKAITLQLHGTYGHVSQGYCCIVSAFNHGTGWKEITTFDTHSESHRADHDGEIVALIKTPVGFATASLFNDQLTITAPEGIRILK